MGYIVLDAIVVTDDRNMIQPLHDKAVEMGLRPTPMSETVMNGYVSFLIPPCGSKYGWDAYKSFHKTLLTYEHFLSNWESEDGCTPDWIRIAYGGDYAYDNYGGTIEGSSGRDDK